MITSPRNPQIARAARLKKSAMRDEERRFLVEGVQAVEALLDAGGPVEALYVTDPDHPLARRAIQLGVEVIEVGEAVMGRLTSTVTPQGLVAITSFLDVDLDELAADACLAIVCAGRDPGNAGSVIRSADAAGAGGVVFTADSVDVYNPKTVRSTAGSLFHLPIVRGVEVAEAVASLQARGVRVLATVAGGARGHDEDDLSTADLSGPVAFLFGNEAWGLAPEVAAMADGRVRIPIAGQAESLNLAAAAAVCLFEWARRRQLTSAAASGEASGGDDASEAGDDIARLVAAAAHDLRSPVAATRSLTATLLHRELPEDARRMIVEGIAYDADRMDTIVQQLIDAARIVSGGIEWHADPTDLAKLVGDLLAVRALNPEAPAVEVDLAGAPGEIAIDPARVRTSIAAMLEAAGWFARGAIRLTLRVKDERLRIEVTREQASVASDDVAGLFEPRSAGSGGGSKLGLYVMREIARSVGGEAVVQVDDMLTLTVDFPAGPTR